MILSAFFKKRLKYYDLELSFSCPSGKTMVMIGPSGGGKTTVIRMLAGLETPDDGLLRFGEEIWFDSERRVNLKPQKRRLGYVFQDYALVPELTVEENVYLTSMIRGTSKEEYQAQTLQILDRIGLSDRLTHKHNELSGGQQQRVAIARAMVNKPEILFADEPCANLDSESSRNVLDLFKQINKEMAQTIVMVSHEDWHMEYFDRVIILRDGKIVSDGPPPEEILEKACKYT